MAKSLLQMAKAAILFTLCTTIFYYGILWVSHEFSEYHKYDEPEGKALKVMSMNVGESDLSIDERIKRFLWMGE
ncbi:YqzK family protein [Shouchella clausii]|jgi:hypothetical protein|uniref:DUF4227 domain-containing protein n=3 Tax=Shouchella TaxID=2893057 RepID=Q5WH39_SHOC1|nr:MULTISPECIES: YqzK family protein [Shouchella]MCM3312554.1 YqzK family protein [Psychrobacillus sp. MER TA 17]PAD41326.1 DUF4227 domain-containing protein [Bacillus sp. 7520-S]SPU21856.1 Uncharacterized membrane protein yqzK [Niallia circulans]ALA51042.1 hypothetical protein DB29_00214 [Shouchella clausii]AST97987.1 hypothetical protein BC8716_19365 [Shouchella clausii]